MVTKAFRCYKGSCLKSFASDLFRELPTVLALILCYQLPSFGSAQSSLCAAIRSHHARDFEYAVEQQRVVSDSMVLNAKPMDFARRDSLTIMVDSGSVSIETAHWSLGINETIHLGFFKRAQTSQGYFFSLRDPLSVLYWALDNAADTTEQAHSEGSILTVRVKENRVWLTRVDILCEDTGRLRKLKAWYAPQYGVSYNDEFLFTPKMRNPVLIESYTNAVTLVDGRVQLSGPLADFPVIDTEHPVLPWRKH